MQVQAHFIDFTLFKKHLEDHVYDFTIMHLFVLILLISKQLYSLALHNRDKVSMCNVLSVPCKRYASASNTAQTLSVSDSNVVSIGLSCAFGLSRQMTF